MDWIVLCVKKRDLSHLWRKSSSLYALLGVLEFPNKQNDNIKYYSNILYVSFPMPKTQIQKLSLNLIVQSLKRERELKRFLKFCETLIGTY